jgi:hypothetical protein
MVGVVKLYDKRDDLIFPTVNFPFISQQPENCENRNDPDLVQSFLKKLRLLYSGYANIYTLINFLKLIAYGNFVITLIESSRPCY